MWKLLKKSELSRSWTYSKCFKIEFQIKSNLNLAKMQNQSVNSVEIGQHVLSKFV